MWLLSVSILVSCNAKMWMLCSFTVFPNSKSSPAFNSFSFCFELARGLRLSLFVHNTFQPSRSRIRKTSYVSYDGGGFPPVETWLVHTCPGNQGSMGA